MSEEHQAPPRLIELGGPAGDCLRQAIEQRAPSLSVPRFVELRERRLGRARRQRGLLLATFAAATILGAVALRPQEPPASIHAENAAVARNAQPAELAAAPSPAEPPKAPGQHAREARATSPALPPAAVAAPVLRSAKPRSTETRRRDDEKAAIEPDSSRAASASACAELTRSGAAEQALACYEALAQGSGMVAELALFEQARLEGKMMHRPARALLKLDSYRQRFPHGSLRGEVMLAQIEWLLASGDKAGARRVVEEALGSGLLRERTAELQRLQSTLLEPQAP